MKNNKQKFAGICKECHVDFDLLKASELKCEYSKCPAFAENSLVKVEMIDPMNEINKQLEQLAAKQNQIMGAHIMQRAVLQWLVDNRTNPATKYSSLMYVSQNVIESLMKHMTKTVDSLEEL